MDQPGGPSGSGDTARDNLDLIHWILNQDFSSQNSSSLGGPEEDRNYTDDEIEAAIWDLTDNDIFVGNTTPGVGAVEIAIAALNNDQRFVPGEGDVIDLFFEPSAEAKALGQDRQFIVGMSFDALKQDCLCDFL